MVSGKKKELPDHQRNVVPSAGNDGPYLQDIQEQDFRKLMDARQEAAKGETNEKVDTDDSGASSK